MNSPTTERLIIMGSGPAALTAAIYAARAGVSPLIIEGNTPGGQLMSTTYVENWPGEKSILGPTLILKMRDQAIQLGARFISETVTEAILIQTQLFTLVTDKNRRYSAHSIIIAAGATPKKLHCAGEAEYWGKGVTTCAVCDGAFYKNKKVVIVGGGDTAMEDASFMTNFTDSITVVHILPDLTASLAMRQKILSDSRITVLYNNTVTAILGNGKHVTQAIITHQDTKKQEILDTDAVFIAIGLSPNTQVFKGQLELTKYGYIKIYDYTHTSLPGVFAAGDVADARYRQAITAAGTGCAAALDAERYLKELSR